jgi:hypothetical protein
MRRVLSLDIAKGRPRPICDGGGWLAFDLTTRKDRVNDEEGETAAEKRRRLAALGMGGYQGEDSSDSDEEEGPRREGGQTVQESGHEDKRVHVGYGQEQGDRLRRRQRG